MSNHSERAHALLSPSGAHRWMNCTPSAKLEAQFPDTTSEAAKEGTLAHELAEAKLANYADEKAFSKRKLTTRKKKLSENPLWNPEMDGYTDEYIDFIKKAAMEFKSAPHIDIEKKLDLSKWIPESFGTADCVLVGDNVLHIIDFKYGKGVPVSAEANEQLMIYALGAYAIYSIIFRIETIRMSIVQPRIVNNSTWEISGHQMHNFVNLLRDRATQAMEGTGEHTPGDWCRFCRAAAVCRARADENVKLAFATEQKAETIAPEEIGNYLRLGEDVARWLSDLKDYALAQCLNGQEIPGYKAVEGRGTRVWTDMDKAFAILTGAGTDEALLWERKPVSLAQIEKLIGKKDFADKVGEYVEKKPGKPALVPESDKREAITNITKAADAFAAEKGE